MADRPEEADLAAQAAIAPTLPAGRSTDRLAASVTGAEPNIGKVDAATANYVEGGPAPYVCGNCRFIVWGTSREGQDPQAPSPADDIDLCQIVEGPYEGGGIKPVDACRFFAAKPDARNPSLVVIAGGARGGPDGSEGR